MTNNEASKWIQLYIDLAKIDPATGEEAYLNEDDRKTLEAMGMARDALTCNRLATNLQPCKQDDLIRRSYALGCYHDWVDRYGDVHTPDEMAEYRAIEALPSVEPKLNKEKIGDLLWNEYRIMSSHLSAEGVVTRRYYCKELWKELFGEEETPVWMTW